MSCETLSQGSTGLQVSMASLPEGFCPASMQELANAIAERLIVSPNQSFTSFATGSVEPSSNVGPWLKDCLEWFVFDDATATYIPLKVVNDFSTMVVFDIDGSFTVPSFITKLQVEVWGSGGGGGSSVGGGGGGGGYARSFLTVNPATVMPVVIGIGGVAQTAGTNTTFSTLIGNGGSGGTNGGAGASGAAGGSATGTEVVIGDGGGAGDGSVTGGHGGGSGKGGGGARGPGSGAAGVAGLTPGGGGSGGSTGGTGANGRVLIIY